MLHADWYNTSFHALGLALHGNAIEELGPQGETIIGDTLAILLNAGPEAVMFDLPRHADQPPARWELLIDTALPNAREATFFVALRPVPVAERSLLLLREEKPTATSL